MSAIQAHRAFARTPAAQSAPAVVLPTREGTVSLSALRGQVVVVDFWASWCEPCRRSFPWLGSLQKRYGPRGLVVVAVDLDKERSAAERFLNEVPAPFTVAFDPSGTSAEAFHVGAMPSTFVIGRDGTVLLAHAGFDPKHTAAVESLIEGALRP